VNQNQTYRQEVDGGYLWSPKRKKNQQLNPFYEFMREVAPGDVIFSFRDTRIAALGIALSYCYESPKPTEFGLVGANWSQIGWKIDVVFRELENRIRPKEHTRELRAFLGIRYAPLRSNGDGLQSVYLTEISPMFASELYRLIGQESHRVEETAGGIGRASKRDQGLAAPDAIDLTIEVWEHREELVIQQDLRLAETERDALVLARRGQGRYRKNVQQVEHACRVTRVDRAEHLVASHTKPWRDSTNDERLDGENGLLLTPTIDHLFDRGFISFENNGDLIVSPVAHHPSLTRMGIAVNERVNVGTFSQGQRCFLEYHRDSVLRLARVKRI
jgi:hypothetical protein